MSMGIAASPELPSMGMGGTLTITSSDSSKILPKVKQGRNASLVVVVVVRCGDVCVCARVEKLWIVCCAVPTRINAQRKA